jgi:hypothetical protein
MKSRTLSGLRGLFVSAVLTADECKLLIINVLYIHFGGKNRRYILFYNRKRSS